jgi:internalin A
LNLADTRISDEGLEYLKRMKGLAVLNLHHTAVTDEGVRKLQQALPYCIIELNPPTDQQKERD